MGWTIIDKIYCGLLLWESMVSSSTNEACSSIDLDCLLDPYLNHHR